MNDLVSDVDIESVLSWIDITKAMMMVIIGWVIASISRKFFMRTAQHKLSAHQLLIYGRLIFYTLCALFAVTAIQQLGFKISVLLGAAGILTVALGFASQTSASNLISGLFLLGEKPFEVGDTLRVDGDTGEVISIDMLSVKLRTFDNLFVRIPNEVLIKSKFINLSKFPIRRIDLLIGVAYREDLSKVIALLLEIANDQLLCLEEPLPFCGVTNYGDSSIDLQLCVWCRRDVFRQLKSDLMVTIKSRFDSEDIEIPFPHISIYSGSESNPIAIKSVVDKP